MDRLKPPEEMNFSTTDTNLPERWAKWKQSMELFLSLSLADKEEKEQLRAVLYIIGQQGRDIYNTMTFAEDEQNKLTPLFKKFDDFCKPKQNITVERYKFNTHTQKTDQTIDEYVMELKLIAKNCGYGELEDDLVRDRIVCGVTSGQIKERLLREEELTLEKTMRICRAAEESKKQVKLMHDDKPTSIHGIKQEHKSQKKGKALPKPPSKQQCGNCGKSHPKRQCVAYGKECRKCGKLSHFAKFCRSGKSAPKHINVVSRQGTADERGNQSQCEPVFIGAVNQIPSEVSGDELFKTITIKGVPVKFKLDTGAQANILPLYFQVYPWDPY